MPGARASPRTASIEQPSAVMARTPFIAPSGQLAHEAEEAEERIDWDLSESPAAAPSASQSLEESGDFAASDEFINVASTSGSLSISGTFQEAQGQA